jgi:NCAIR mutase (PurE)-related protein
MLRSTASRCNRCIRQHLVRAASSTAASGDSQNVQELRAVLGDVASGRMSVQDAAAQLEPHVTSGLENISQFAKIDHLRAARTGIPEVVFGEGKSSQQIREILLAMIRRRKAAAAGDTARSLPAIVSRICTAKWADLQDIAGLKVSDLQLC